MIQKPLHYLMRRVAGGLFPDAAERRGGAPPAEMCPCADRDDENMVLGPHPSEGKLVLLEPIKLINTGFKAFKENKKSILEKC